jgi:GNAT superfamily N-acetyltransferase
MPLTVLPNTFAQSTAELVRLFHQSQLEWSRHLGEETQLDFGRWISNPALPDSTTANCLHDARLLSGFSAARLIKEMEAKANATGVPWRFCSLNPSMPPDQSQALADALTQSGWKSEPLRILHRKRIETRAPTTGNLDLTIIPTRASHRHHRQLLETREREIKGDSPLFSDAKRGLSPFSSSAVVEAELLHLDDAHLDSLLALRDGEAVGGIGVLTSGEVGTLRDWYVTRPHRSQGIGRLLLDRALEICNRAMLRHVMIGLPATAGTALDLAQRAGLAQVGTWNAYTLGPRHHCLP